MYFAMLKMTGLYKTKPVLSTPNTVFYQAAPLVQIKMERMSDYTYESSYWRLEINTDLGFVIKNKSTDRIVLKTYDFGAVCPTDVKKWLKFNDTPGPGDQAGNFSWYPVKGYLVDESKNWQLRQARIWMSIFCL